MNPKNRFYFFGAALAWYLACTLALPFDSPPTREGKDFALFIAIDEYDSWTDLRNPIRDAEAIAQELEKEYGFETEILRNPTEVEVFDKLYQYANMQYYDRDQLIIFFSGHGHLIRSTKEGFIIPRDAQSISDDPYGRSFMSHDRLRNIVANMPCKHLLLILDSCFSGTFDERIIKGERGPLEREGVIKLNAEDFEHRSLLYLTAGGDEYVDDGSSHSPFARAFLLALRSFGDLNSDGIINFLELSAYIQSAVKGQKPTAGDFEEHMGGDFYFVKSGATASTTAQPGKPATRKGMAHGTTPFTSVGELSLSPNWSPDAQWIAYASDDKGSMDIWKKPASGGKAVQLTKLPGNETHPVWSPDGRYLAFASDGQNGGIHYIRGDGGESTQLVSFGGTPDWSPDGQQLIFESNGNIYLVDFESGDLRLLVEGTSANPYPIWMPDGRHIVFWHRTKGDVQLLDLKSGEFHPLSLVPPGQEIGSLDINKEGNRLLLSRGAFGGNKSLYEVLLDSGDYLPLEAPYRLAATTTDDIDGVYAPDGNRIAFSARLVERHLYSLALNPNNAHVKGKPKALTRDGKLNYYPAFSADGASLVWTSHRSGQGNLYYRTLLEEAELVKVTAEYSSKIREISGCFAPDGRQLYFATTQRGSYELFRIPASGETGVPITKTNNPLRDVHPSLSSDGNTLVFYSNRSGSWDIWRLPLDRDEAPQPLTDWPSNELYPVWSPDGQRIAFRSDRTGNADIWTLPADGGDAQPLIVHPAEEVWSAWSPDGQWFYFISNRSGLYNLWRLPTGGDTAEAVTEFNDLAFGLPENGIYTKFAVSDQQIVLSLEERRGDIYIWEPEQ